MKNLFNAPPPPPDKRPFLRLVKIGPGQRLQFIILSDRLFGASTHYVDGRTTICLGVDDGCEWCAKGFAPRWSGCLAVSPVNHLQALLLMLTPGAYHNCPELASGPTGLRGKVIACERMGKSTNSPLKVELHESDSALKMLPRLPNPDVPGALCRLWSLNGVAESQIDGTQDEPAHKTDEVLKREMEAQDEPRPVDVADFAGPVGQMF